MKGWDAALKNWEWEWAWGQGYLVPTAFTCDDSFSIRSDANSVTDHIGVGYSEQLLARVCVPHPHIIMTARSIELGRTSEGKKK